VAQASSAQIGEPSFLLAAMCFPDARESSATAHQCVVLVDPYSTGAMLAPELAQRGFTVMALWTDEAGENRNHIPKAAKGFPEKYLTEVEETLTLADTAKALGAAAGEFGAEIIAIICGGETGVKVTDALAEHMGLRGNSTQNGMENRRDKCVQQEAVARAGLRSVRSACGKTWDEVAAFTRTEEFPIIVKPVESAGSDGVKLCHTPEEAREHFHLLMISQRKCGSQCAAVLLQEFLRGKEYIVDHVSRDGVHKTTLVWVYDRRPANGSDFVCFGQQCVLADEPVAQQLIAYTRGVLDALNITNGATHTEVMMTPTGPCLVEVNSRCHGAAGSWMPLAQAMTGYTQVSACVDAFVDVNAFDRLPDVPRSPFLASGQVVMTVSFHEGLIEATPGFQKIRALKSFLSLQENLHVGDQLQKTVDLFGITGMCVLVHSDAEVLKSDVAAIRKMEAEGSLFRLSVTPGSA